ncbi:cytochrome P450 [Aspergillus vadensis CBS 113365]|uniref:Cytochrome P450 monooxygenase n=1 Tax=Aspergillus vadensis (strain CBS 113365 / IMI 142717 / IBT 24658) TaxID=1448311 RepID=A0A319BKU5_ASPVC|nr:cytochrome P450 monooxygenase [Aspergillus vadensis CBS 113365]PYH73327.1 cytochrome P450 monooxygenase [Aspergillus vadensis CBS 113365]
MVSTTLTAALAGVFSHLTYFRRGEHQLHGTTYTQVFVVLYATAVAYLHVSWGTAWREALVTVSLHAASYLLGTFSSLLLYRLVFHPLGSFPGPWLARVSDLWLVSQMKNNNKHVKLVELHERYGPYVRIGPSTLSVIDPKAVNIIHGPASRCLKSGWYDHSYPNKSLQTSRDPAEHQQRRRLWSTAFGSKQLRGYEHRVRKYREQLVDQLMKREGQPVNVTKWFDLYTYDVMGDLAFGEGFGCLEQGEYHWATQIMMETMDFVGSSLPMWLFRMVLEVPGLKRAWYKFLDYCEMRLVERMRNEPDVPDVSAALLAPFKGKEPGKEDQQWLGGDSRLIIVAGSDTTASTLVALFYELAHRPEEVEKLRAELAPFVNKGGGLGDFYDSDIGHLGHLNGAINEALRLYPAVPSGVPRIMPSEGITVNGVSIPGNTIVINPTLAMGRSELSYKKPLEFIPERWYQQPELINDQSAFVPFNIGTYNCIGKPLALQNLRATVAHLVTTFDVKFAPGNAEKDLIRRSKDCFVLYHGELDLIFTRRK